MSKIQINTKSSSYQKEKEQFLKDLREFYQTKSSYFRPPIIAGKEIDLYLFYTLVQQKGGWSKVNAYGTWDTFLKPLHLPSPCVNGSALLRKIYSLCLERYERAKGPPTRGDDDYSMDADEDSRSRRGGGTLRSITSSKTAATTYIPDRSVKIAGPSERLALSLLSPLPNEQDFAINVCTLLAADYSNRLPIHTVPHIIDFLLAHAGVYNHSSLRDTIGRSYRETRGSAPDLYWRARAGGGGAKELAHEAKFSVDLHAQAVEASQTLERALKKEEEGDDELFAALPEPVEETWVSEPTEEDSLFAPSVQGGARCLFTQRVIQVANIMRSLSFHEDNYALLAKNTTVLRFSLLCANCWDGTLRQCGLDILTNVASEIVIKEPATCLISRHILSTVQAGLGPDRARTLASLQLLARLATNVSNEYTLLSALDVYDEVCSLLTIRDIMLLVCALECLYSLTSLGERACDRVAHVSHTLIALLTLEAQSYGPRACILMRVVETVSGPALPTDQTQAQTQPAQPANLTAQPAAQPAAQATQPAAQTTQSIAPTTTTQPAATTSAAAQPDQYSVQQAHAQQQNIQENEKFAISWLRAAYEPMPTTQTATNIATGSDTGEVYRQYVACCSKLGRKGVIAPPHFPRLVRNVFGGTVGPVGDNQQLYVGIRPRNIATRNQMAANNTGPCSPILKAQLTTKTELPKNSATLNQQQQQVVQESAAVATPTPASSGNNTTLIKHLLASKVTPTPIQQNTNLMHNYSHVAQRQQNQQRMLGQQQHTTQSQPVNPMDIDPESLIKCNTITTGGVTTEKTAALVTTSLEEMLVKKDIPIVSTAPTTQMAEETTYSVNTKAAQNKMLTDLLEKKSIPPVQLLNPPTIQITETGQILQVKNEPAELVQLKAENSGGMIQIKNELGQLIQLRNERGQIIQIQKTNEQGHIVNNIIQNAPERVNAIQIDHSYTQEPPNKKAKTEDEQAKDEPRDTSSSKSAANLYAALAASVLQDEEELQVQQPTLQVQQPTMQVQQQTMQVQQQSMQVQQQTMQVQQQTMQVQQQAMQVQQQTMQMQVQQPVLQVQPMEMHSNILTQGGQIIIQEKPGQYIQQQPVQIIATQGTSQGLSYIQGNVMQPHKTIIIVQGAGGSGPITLTVNNAAGLDEAALSSLVTQATETIVHQQQQIVQSTGQLVQQQSGGGQQMIVTQKQNQPIITSSSPLILTQGQQMMSPQIMMSGQQHVIVNASNVHRVVQQPTMQVHQQVIMTTQQHQSQQQQVKVAQPQHIKVAPQPQQIKVAPQPQQIKAAPQIVKVTQPTQQVKMNDVSKPQSAIQQQLAGPKPTAASIVQQMRQVLAKQPVVKHDEAKRAEVIKNVQAKAQTQQQTNDDSPWICHWKNCGRRLENAASVYAHCAREHVTTEVDKEQPCLWALCDRISRRPFALLNHLHDRHCTVQALKTMATQRKTAQEIATEPSAAQTTPSSGTTATTTAYPPNAALAALNKHATTSLNPRELMDENEGPVTKSIRLTAALILRNIALYSNTGRRQLRAFEHQLANIALSNVEASRTVAQILYDMNSL